jgi:molecular chaperone DnaK
VGIPPAPRGVPQVEVTFDIDANGIVNVSAKDKATGKEQAIRIEASGGLSDTEIDRMVQEAEANAEEDRNRRELAEARNQAEGLIHTTERQLEEHGDKIEAGDKAAIEEALQAVKDVKDGEDAAPIQEKTAALAAAAMKLGEAMYKAQQEEEAAGQAETAGPGADPTVQPGEDDATIVDADFEEVDEERRDKSA